MKIKNKFKIKGTVIASDKSPVPDALVELFFSDASFSKVKCSSIQL